jgi:hypothetical protein
MCYKFALRPGDTIYSDGGNIISIEPASLLEIDSRKARAKNGFGLASGLARYFPQSMPDKSPPKPWLSGQAKPRKSSVL